MSDLTFPNVSCKHHHYEHNYENLKEELAKNAKNADAKASGHQISKRQTDELKLKNDTAIKAMLLTNSSIGPDQLNDKYLEVVRKHSLAAKKPVKPANTKRKYYWDKPVSSSPTFRKFLRS